METNRIYDMKAEQELTKFLDKYFYSKLEGLTFERKNDKPSQFKGIDLILSKKDKSIKIDEKAALSYINKDIKTFSFEIDFINQAGKVQEGWLFNKDLETNAYVLMYIKAKHEDFKTLKEEDIIEVEVLMIDKVRILNYLKHDEEYIKNMAQWLRNQNYNGRYNIEGLYDYAFYSSLNYGEKPINILIRKEKLIDLSSKHFIVKRSALDEMIRYKKL
jgi:hypothetical protein